MGIKEINQATKWFFIITTIFTIILVFIIVADSLISNSMGLKYYSQSYNDTRNVVSNYTQGTQALTSQVSGVFIMVGLFLLVVLFIGIITYIFKKINKLTNFKEVN